MAKQLTRSELYELVWSEPLRTLSKQFGVSDVALAKCCRRAGVPLPGIGYWAKHVAGKSMPRPALPRREFGQADEITIGGNRYYYHTPSDKEILDTPIPPPPVFEQTLDEVSACARQMLGTRKVAATLTNPHSLIAKLLQEDEVRRQKQKSSPWPSIFDKPLYDSPLERRRLRIINGLFLALARCGCRPSLHGREPQELGVHVGDQHVGFKLAPTSTRPQRSPQSDVKGVSTRLKMELTWWQPPSDMKTLWEDEDSSPLEDQLHEFAVNLLVAGERLHRASVEHRRQCLIERKQRLEEKIRQEEEEAIRKERERIAKLEKERRDLLFSEAAAWRRADQVRAYVRKYMEVRGPDCDPQQNKHLEDWARWALAEADRIDPLTRASNPR